MQPLSFEQMYGHLPDETQELIKKPHLLILEQWGGRTRPIIPGSPLFWAREPEHGAAGLVPLVISRITKHSLEMVCACGQRDCSRKIVLSGQWTGKHPDQHKQAAP